MAYIVDGESLDWRVDITVDKNKVDANLTNKELYVDLAGLDNNFWNNVKSDGGDIRATLSDSTTRVPVELKNFNSATKVGQLYLKVSTISASVDTKVYIYWGNATLTQPLANTTYGSENVWDANSKLVAHLEESGSGSADEFKDSSANANHGQGGGGTATKSPAQAQFKSGNGQDFDGTNDHINFGNASSIDPGGALTLECFVRLDVNNAHQVFFIRSNSGGTGLSYEFRLDNQGKILIDLRANSGTASAWTGTTVLSTATDYHLAVTWDGTTTGAGNVNLYINGTVDETFDKTSALSQNASSNVTVGAMDNSTNYNPLNGKIDEARISNIDRSAAWIKATYENFNNTAGFYTIGSYAQSLAERAYATIID